MSPTRTVPEPSTIGFSSVNTWPTSASERRLRNALSLSLPLAAVTAEAQQPYVWVVDPATAKVRRTPVQLGAYGETRVPVIAGVGAQDWVVIAGVHLLREGQAVRPVDRNNRAVALVTN